MAERAAHLVDHVFPQVGVRQWVLTVPWGRRFLLARDHALARGVLKLVIKEIFAWVSRAIGRRGPLDAASGAVTVIQRFGSALRLNVHFHILVLDGGYTETESCSAKTPYAGFSRLIHGPCLREDAVGLALYVVDVSPEIRGWNGGFGPSQISDRSIQATPAARALL